MKTKLLYPYLTVIITLCCATTGFNQTDVNDSLSRELDELFGQPEDDEVITFSSTRIINGHSIEHLPKKVLELRVEHRFGDIAGTNGGVQTMFGLDNSADIRIALEYGITDNLMIGFGRSKGSGEPYKSLLDGFIKYRFLKQEKGRSPISMGVLGGASFSYQKASTDSTDVAFFPKTSHRLAYTTQLNIARKFHKRFSMAVMPTVVHRNYVASDDMNTIFSLGAGARIGLSSTTAILLEYFHCFSKPGIRQEQYNSIGISFEWITFGHNFTINFTNARGFGETQFITNTYADWLKGQFRFGFSIGRKFEY